MVLFAFMSAVTDGPSTFSIVTGVVGTVVTGITVFLKINVYNSKLPRSLEEAFQEKRSFSEKELMEIVLQEELASKNSTSVKLVSKTMLRLRFIYTFVFALLLFLLLNSLYYKFIAIPLLCVLVIAYEVAFLKTNTYDILCFKVKRNPDKIISNIIYEETYNEAETPKYIRTVLASCVLVAVAVACFIGLHTESRYSVKSLENGCAVSSYMPGLFDSRSVVIPDSIDGEGIISISDSAFAGNIYIEEVAVPDTVRYIESKAFSGCSSLNKITMGENIVRIGSGAFKGCSSLEQIELPAGLKELNGEAFKNCGSLITITVPEGVTEIRGNTFEGCSELESVVLHDGIVDIHAYAFKGCTELKEIELPSKITEIHAYTFEECDSLGSVYIPRGVTRIAAHAFYGCDSLYEVYVPDTVTEIGSSAFRECKNLKEIYLPENVSVNERAFKDSPTEIYDKIFTDEISDEIDREFQETAVEKIYAIYDKSQGHDVIYSYYGDTTILVADSPKIEEYLSDDMDTFVIETPAELLEYLKNAREEGFDNVVVGRYSEVASQATGEVYIVAFSVDMNDLIETYEKDASEF